MVALLCAPTAGEKDRSSAALFVEVLTLCRPPVSGRSVPSLVAPSPNLFQVTAVLLGANPHPKWDVLVTGVNRDDYRSTLGKGFLGLDKMAKQYPDKKWYGLLDDDCFLIPNTLVEALSAFDPDEPWCVDADGKPVRSVAAFPARGVA